MYLLSARRKGNFRSTSRLQWVRRVPCFPLFTLLVSMAALTVSMSSDAATASEKQNARKQIYNHAMKLATADIARVAERKQWKDHQVKVNVFIPSEVSSFPACKTPLQGALPTGDKMDLARLRYDIRCEDGAGWEIGVTVKPDIYIPVVVAKTVLERGEIVSANNIELKKRNISSSRSGYITNPDDAVGLTVKKRIRDMQPIAPSQLEQPILVNRGQQVLMIAEQDGIEARTMGEAMKNGRKGDLIKVRNLGSKKIVTATVDGAGVVRMLYAPGQ